jgi:hypothetical protein
MYPSTGSILPPKLQVLQVPFWEETFQRELAKRGVRLCSLDVTDFDNYPCNDSDEE